MEGGVDDVLELEFVVIEGIPTRETVINITIVEVTVTSGMYCGKNNTSYSLFPCR